MEEKDSKTITPQEIAFDSYLKSLSVPEKNRYRGRLDLAKFEIQELADAFVAIKAEINARWRAHSARIKAPTGPVDLHVDYIDATVLNAIAFGSKGTRFVGITDKMLKHFSETAGTLWGSSAVHDLLLLDATESVKNFLFQAALLIQLQFISSHELGHHFHGHVGGQALFEEFSTPSGTQPTDNLLRQAREVEADGYSVHMLLDNLIAGDSGKQIYARLGSSQQQDHCILTLFLMCVGSFFFFLPPQRFDSRTCRAATHPFFLARMNVVVNDLNGWCEGRRPDLKTWGSLEKFQAIMNCVKDAAKNAASALGWLQQSEFLNSPEGNQYLADLYAAREKLRGDMGGRRWDLGPLPEGK